MVRILAIAAMDEERAIGKDGTLPWHHPADLKRFSELTTGHAVLMGRTTYESLPDSFRPLPKRLNVVITTSPSKVQHDGSVLTWDSPLSFFDAAEAGDVDLPSKKIWIIGGAELYRSTLRYWDELYLTRVPGSHAGDTFFPPFEKRMRLVETEEADGLTYEHYLGLHIK